MVIYPKLADQKKRFSIISAVDNLDTLEKLPGETCQVEWITQIYEERV